MGALLDCPTTIDTKKTLSFHQKITAVIKYLEPYVIDIRRRLHQVPEIGWEEEKTILLLSTEIREAIALSQMNYEFRFHSAKGGIWVDVIKNKELPFLLFRSDIDALPIEEETNLAFASTHKGRMHACGHDCHSAMLLGAFQAITKGLIIPNTNIRFVWQRAEECGPSLSGGKMLVEEGVCEGIDFAFGLHVSPTKEPDVFVSKPGVYMANAAMIQFEIECSGGHVMSPQIGSNAIQIMIDIHNSLRGFEGIFFDPSEPIAFVPSIAKSGIAHNIRPNHATMCFALRNFLSVEMRNKFVESVISRVKTIIQTYPTARLSHLHFCPGYPSLKNDHSTYRHVNQILKDFGQKTEKGPHLFSGEDFSYYLNTVPGAFWLLGTGDKESADCHTSTFNPNEKSLKTGVAYWLLLAQQPPMRN